MNASATYRLTLSLTLLFLLILNIYFFKSAVLGMILFLSLIVFLGYWVSLIFFEELCLKYILGVLIVISWIILSESVLFFYKRLALPYLLIPISLIPPFLFICSNTFGKSKQPLSPRQHDEKRAPMRMIMLHDRLTGLATLIFVSSIIICFLLLFMARTGSVIAIVWDAINPIFWISFAVSVVSLLYILQQNTIASQIKMVFSCIFSFELFGMLLMVHKYMWGFDPWVHLAFLKKLYLIGGLGEGKYSPLEYIGYRSFVASVAKLSSLSVNHLYWLHLLIIPILASIFIPYLTFLTLDFFLNREENTWPAAISFIFFPLFMMMNIALPNNLAIILVLACIYLVSRQIVYKKKIGFIPIFSTALAAILVHQQYGAPAVMMLLIATPFIIKGKRKWKTVVLSIRIKNSTYSVSSDIFRLFLVLICFSVSAFFIPLLLVVQPLLYQLLYPEARVKIPTLTNITLSSLKNFLLPSWFPSGAIQPLYLFWDNFKLIRYLIIAFGGYLLLKKRKHVAIPYLLSIFTVYLSWFIVETVMVNIPFGRTSHRFGMMIDTFLLPLLGVMLCKYIRVVKVGFKKHKLRSLIVICLVVLVACTSVYSGFDFDRIINRPDPLRERVVTDDYIETLNYINETAAGRYYVIVSDLYFGKVAAGYLGLRPYYPPGNPFVHVNIGNQINRYFFEIASNPSLFEPLMIEVMNKTHSTLGFYVIDDYWLKIQNLTTINKIKQIKRIADEWKVFGEENKIYVFKYSMPITIHRPTLYFDGVNDYVEVPDTPALNPPTITLEAFVKPLSIEEEQEIINKWYHIPLSQAQYRLRIINNRFDIRLNINGTFISCYSNPIEAGKWYHVVGTYDGTQIKIYVNGILDNIVNVTGSINTAGTLPLKLGIYGNNVSIPFNGYIAYVRLYNRALTADEVAYNYKHPSNPVQDGLVLWLPMDEGVGNKLHDKSGYDNNGTVFGAQWVEVEVLQKRCED